MLPKTIQLTNTDTFSHHRVLISFKFYILMYRSEMLSCKEPYSINKKTKDFFATSYS